MRLVKLSLLLLSTLALAKPDPSKLKDAEFDKKVNEILKAHQIPGAAVSVVTSKGLVKAKGYGLRNIDKKLPVTPDTLFAIGSTTKAFTATGLGILAESKSAKFSFNTPIRKYLKDFRLRNKIATRMTTAVDLLAHRTGLPRHDLVWYLNPKKSRQEIFRSLKYLELSDSFRNQFQYNNLMYMTAGILVERLSGQTWEQFTREKILNPLNMKRTTFTIDAMEKDSDHSLAYTMEDNKLVETPFARIDNVGPAGSMNSSVTEMARWVQLQLDRDFKHSPKIVSRRVLDYIHVAKVGVPRPVKSKFFETQSDAYSLGWSIRTYRGERIFSHAGGIDGFLTYVLFAPDSDFGLVVLTNGDHENGMAMISNTALDMIMGAKSPRDWSKDLKKPTRPKLPPVKKIKLASKLKIDGTFTHPAYGKIQLSKNDETSIKFKLGNSDDGILPHMGKNVFAFDIWGQRMKLVAKVRKNKIVSLTIPLQPGVKPIRFKRK